MLIYTLVVVCESFQEAINTTKVALSCWDDEMGSVYRLMEVCRVADQRAIVKVITNQSEPYCDRTLNDWLTASLKRKDSRGDHITGDLVWWGGPVR